MRYSIYRQSYSELQAYRYSVLDEEERPCCLAEPTGLFLPNPTRQISLFDPDHEPLAYLDPPPTSPWRMGGTYTLLPEGGESPLALIEERWSLVDRILLRLPRYLLRIEDLTYTAHGHRYGERLYQLFALTPGKELEPVQEEQLPPMDEEELRATLPEALASFPVGGPVGEIIRPNRGPNYIIEVTHPALAQAPLILTAMVVLVDLHLWAHPL